MIDLSGDLFAYKNFSKGKLYNSAECRVCSSIAATKYKLSFYGIGLLTSDFLWLMFGYIHYDYYASILTEWCYYLATVNVCIFLYQIRTTTTTTTTTIVNCMFTSLA